MTSVFRVFINKLLIILCFSLPAQLSSAQDTIGLDTGSIEKQILDARLQGQLSRANALAQTLSEDANHRLLGMGLEIDNLATELSWNTESQTHDARIETLADALIEHCNRKFSRVSASDAFQCGRGHFALSFLSGVRGQYYAAGVNGTQAIKAFESALERDPENLAIKLPLGMAYYYADHLPSFVRWVAPLLWFIPSGSSHKSLPYLRQVSETPGPYQDAALFVLGDLLIQSPTHRGSAWEYFAPIVTRYPENGRIHLALIGSYIVNDDWQKAETAVISLREKVPNDAEQYRLMADMWWVYARWHQDKAIGEDAQRRLLGAQADEQPAWVRTSFELAQALAMETSGDRAAATSRYTAISQRDRWDAWPWLVDIANKRLEVLQ